MRHFINRGFKKCRLFSSSMENVIFLNWVYKKNGKRGIFGSELLEEFRNVPFINKPELLQAYLP